MNCDAISEDLIDALLETANLGTGKAAASLSELTGHEVKIRVPELIIFNAGDALRMKDLQESAVLRIAQNFWDEPTGHALLIFNEAGSLRLTKLILDEEVEAESIGETEQSALLELGNIMINGLIGSMSNQLGLKLSYGIPSIDLKGVKNFEDVVVDFLPENQGKIVFMQAALTISAETIHGFIVLVLDEENLLLILSKLRAII